jgi:hypothetical protein
MRSNTAARVLATFISTGALVAGAMMAAAPAEASSPNSNSRSITSVDPNCLNAVRTQAPSASAAEATSFCTVTTTTTRTVASVPAASTSSLAQPQLTAGAVHSVSWSQTSTSILGLWQETQKGVAYYDGAKVWSTVTYRGYKGSHGCLYGYRYGYTITSISCSYSTPPNHQDITEIDDYRVAAIVEGSPVSWSYGQSTLIDFAGDVVGE